MNNKTRMFGVAVLILTLIVAVILGVAISPGNPLTWLLIAALVSLPYIYRKMTSRQYVQWKDEYSVGIESIDSQHKKLLGLINSLQTAVNYKTGEAFEREALDELVDYTKTHFKFEEDMMEQSAYSDTQMHKSDHDVIRKKLEKFHKRWEVLKGPKELQGFLEKDFKKWYTQHISKWDAQTAPSL